MAEPTESIQTSIRRAIEAMTTPPAKDASLAEKINYLVQALELADLLEMLRQEKDPDDSGRMAVGAALKAMHNFLTSIDAGSGILRKLLTIFDGLEQGRSHPLIIPRTIDNRPRAPRPNVAVRAAAAVALELLADEMKQKAAAARVVRELAKEKVAGLQPTASTVIKWRKDATAKHPDKEMAFYYNHILSLLRCRAEPTRNALALMRVLAHQAQQAAR